MKATTILQACGLTLLGIALAIGAIRATAQTTVTTKDTQIGDRHETVTTITTKADAFEKRKMADIHLVEQAYLRLKAQVANPDFDFDIEFYGGGSAVDAPPFTDTRYDQMVDLSPVVVDAAPGKKLALRFTPKARAQSKTTQLMPTALAALEADSGVKYSRFVTFKVTVRYGAGKSFTYKSVALFSDADRVHLVDTAGLGKLAMTLAPDASSSDIPGPQNGTITVDCSTYSNPAHNATLIQTDDLHHTTGEHGAQVNATESCIYADTQKVNNALCSIVDTLIPASPGTWEEGIITDTLGHHAQGAVSGSSVSATSNGAGLTAHAYSGAAVETCLSCSLAVAINVNGVLTITPSGPLWAHTFDFENDCASHIYSVTYSCDGNGGGHGTQNCSSPLALDPRGQGFHFTGLDHCKPFDINGDGKQECVAWLDPNYDTMFLTLGDHVTDGRHLLGSFSHQRDPEAEHNGWNALASYDFDGDKKITPADPIWPHLFLWDARGQYHTLLSEGITEIPLEHVTEPRYDANGNELKEWGHAIINGQQEPAVDVWLQVRALK